MLETAAFAASSVSRDQADTGFGFGMMNELERCEGQTIRYSCIYNRNYVITIVIFIFELAS